MTQSQLRKQGFGYQGASAMTDSAFSPGSAAETNIMGGLKQHILTLIMSAPQNCSQDRTLPAGKPECLLKNKNCGIPHIDSNLKSRKYLLLGVFCENHAMQYLSMVFRNIPEGERFKFYPISLKSPGIEQPVPFYPLLCAQPLDCTREHFMRILKLNPIDERDDLEALATIFAMSTISVGTDMQLSPDAQKIAQKLMFCEQSHRSNLVNNMSCWLGDTVNLYFSAEYLKENEQQSWLSKMQSSTEVLRSNVGANMTVFEVPLRMFSVLDILTIQLFNSSLKVGRSSNETVAHVPNVQIINGAFAYGTGFGLQFDMTNRKQYIIDPQYPLDVMDVIREKPSVSNVNVLYLDKKTTHDKKPIYVYKPTINECVPTVDHFAALYATRHGL